MTQVDVVIYLVVAVICCWIFLDTRRCLKTLFGAKIVPDSAVTFFRVAAGLITGSLALLLLAFAYRQLG